MAAVGAENDEEVDYIPETQYPESPILVSSTMINSKCVDTPQRLNPSQSAQSVSSRCPGPTSDVPRPTANAVSESEKLAQSMQEAIQRALQAGNKEYAAAHERQAKQSMHAMKKRRLQSLLQTKCEIEHSISEAEATVASSDDAIQEIQSVMDEQTRALALERVENRRQRSSLAAFRIELKELDLEIAADQESLTEHEHMLKNMLPQ